MLISGSVPSGIIDKTRGYLEHLQIVYISLTVHNFFELHAIVLQFSVVRKKQASCHSPVGRVFLMTDYFQQGKLKNTHTCTEKER